MKKITYAFALSASCFASVAADAAGAIVPELSIGPLEIGAAAESVEAALKELNSEYKISPLTSNDKVGGYIAEDLPDDDDAPGDAAFVLIEGGKVVAIQRKWIVPAEQGVVPQSALDSFTQKFGQVDNSVWKSIHLNRERPSLELEWNYGRDGKVQRNFSACGKGIDLATYSGHKTKFYVPRTLWSNCGAVIRAKAGSSYSDSAAAGLVVKFDVQITDIQSQYDYAKAEQDRIEAEKAAALEAAADKAKNNKLAL